MQAVEDIHSSQSDANLRDRALLSSALAAPKQLYTFSDHEVDLIDLTVRLMFRIAKNHPFIDGNKRAGFNSGIAFLILNGVAASFEDEVDPNGRLFKDMVTGEISEESYATWLRLSVLGSLVIAGAKGW